MSAATEPATREVRYGFFSFTEITDPAEHAAYNAWHLYDHMPEQYRLDGVRWGQRWTCRPEAAVVARPPLDGVHYVTCYLMSDPIEQTLDTFQGLADELRAAGRFHTARHAHVAGCFRVVERATAPGEVLAAAVVPFRPHRAAHVRLDACPASAVDDYRGWAATELLPRLLATDGAIGAWTFTAASAARHPTITDRHVTLTWTDCDDDGAGLGAASRACSYPGATAHLDAPLVPVTSDPETWFRP